MVNNLEREELPRYEKIEIAGDLRGLTTIVLYARYSRITVRRIIHDGNVYLGTRVL